MNGTAKGSKAVCGECGQSFIIQRHGHVYCTKKCRQGKHNRKLAELYRRRKELGIN